MIPFLARRLMWFAITLFTVMFVSFFLMRSVKGGPFDNERQLDAGVQATIEAEYHLDWPMWKQFAQYVGPLNLDDDGWFGEGETEGSAPFTGVLSGDFGPSFRYRDFSVNDIIGQALPISMLLGIVSMMWALALGISTGIASALRRGTGLDLSMRLAATAGIALPNFVIASFLIILFVFLVPLFPVAGWGRLEHMILPGFCLGLVFAAYISRLTRTGMLEALSQDYIRTARAKGASEFRVIFRHALRGGILPVISFLGPAIAGILTGSFVIETIFQIPGLGREFVNSAFNRDYTLVLGTVILYASLIVILNLIVDVVQVWLNPKLKFE